MSFVIMESDGSGAILASYVLAGAQLVSQTRNGETSYYLPDAQGSIRLLTDESGNITDSYEYSAYGELLGQSGETENNYLYREASPK
jgi:uncharacterized protein RhaS with RHS repeats